MSDEVKRYWLTNDGMRESEAGAYVFWDAYVRLATKNAQQKSEIPALKSRVIVLRINLEKLDRENAKLKEAITEYIIANTTGNSELVDEKYQGLINAVVRVGYSQGLISAVVVDK